MVVVGAAKSHVGDVGGGADGSQMLGEVLGGRSPVANQIHGDQPGPVRAQIPDQAVDLARRADIQHLAPRAQMALRETIGQADVGLGVLGTAQAGHVGARRDLDVGHLVACVVGGAENDAAIVQNPARQDGRQTARRTFPAIFLVLGIGGQTLQNRMENRRRIGRTDPHAPAAAAALIGRDHGHGAPQGILRDDDSVLRTNVQAGQAAGAQSGIGCDGRHASTACDNELASNWLDRNWSNLR